MSEQLYICDHADRCGKSFHKCGGAKPQLMSKHTEGPTMWKLRPGGWECSQNWVVKLVPYTPPKEAPMEYDLIKPVSIAALESAGACERELHRFAFLMVKDLFEAVPRCDLTAETTVRIASQCEGGIEFLLKEGFIREREPELKACAHCGETGRICQGGVYGTLSQVICPKCGIRTNNFHTREEAVIRWNTRV